MTPQRLPGIRIASLRCSRCGADSLYHGVPHTVLVKGSRIIMRCIKCGTGYAVNASVAKAGAPPEWVIQTLHGLITNGLANILPPYTGPADEDPGEPP